MIVPIGAPAFREICKSSVYCRQAVNETLNKLGIRAVDPDKYKDMEAILREQLYTME